MPLHLPPDVCTDRDRLKYVQLADTIGEQIRAGRLAPGERLPSEGDLADLAGIGKGSVRKAMDELVRYGLVVKTNGAPARVADFSRRVRVLSADTYTHEYLRYLSGYSGDASPFTRGHGIEWDQYQVDVTIRREPASHTDSDLLQVEVGELLWRRYFTKYADGVPVQVQRSAVPDFVVEACPWMIDTAAQPYPGGTVRELLDGGTGPGEITNVIRTRLPVATEERQLRIDGVPVLDWQRVILGAGCPLEASRAVLAGPVHEIRYKTGLQP